MLHQEPLDPPSPSRRIALQVNVWPQARHGCGVEPEQRWGPFSMLLGTVPECWKGAHAAELCGPDCAGSVAAHMLLMV